MTFVKICGLTNPEDAILAMDLGADLLGFVNAENSPRYLTPDEIARIITEIGPIVPTVLVTHSQDVDEIINSFEAAGTNILQLHAPLTFDEYFEIKELVPTVIANISIDAELKGVTDALKSRLSKLGEMADYILLDTKAGKEIGGTGKTYDWSIAAVMRNLSQRPVIMAGGLKPENIADAVRRVRPYAVDVSSGVEYEPGLKDPEKMKAFIRNAKLA